MDKSLVCTSESQLYVNQLCCYRYSSEVWRSLDIDTTNLLAAGWPLCGSQHIMSIFSIIFWALLTSITAVYEASWMIEPCTEALWDERNDFSVGWTAWYAVKVLRHQMIDRRTRRYPHISSIFIRLACHIWVSNHSLSPVRSSNESVENGKGINLTLSPGKRFCPSNLLSFTAFWQFRLEGLLDRIHLSQSDAGLG